MLIIIEIASNANEHERTQRTWMYFISRRSVQRGNVRSWSFVLDLRVYKFILINSRRSSLPARSEHHFIRLLQIISVTVITLVACMLSDKTYLVSIAEEGNNYEAGLYILLCTGILMLIVSVLGWCSAFKHSRYCLATFFSIMLVIVVAQVAFAGWLYAHKDRLDDLVRSSVVNTVKVIPLSIIKHLLNTKSNNSYMTWLLNVIRVVIAYYENNHSIIFRRKNMARYNVVRKSWIQFKPLSNAAEPMDLWIGLAASTQTRIPLFHGWLLAFQTVTICLKYQNPAAKMWAAPLATRVAKQRLPELWALRSTVR